ncbi:aldehyde dehydrogenase family protein [Peristeroidobacter soli]|uniref:aldehyde dehydrogenase family protein n=1 Tax=Peristeroidobacter soli TaxID=2497877 RepID=UPI00101CA837|nr:aldehyde dehydrogenase family protein [Peristeroidobacter soli]
MREYLGFYIDGGWVEPARPETLDVINPANGNIAGRISMGSAADVDRAVQAARRAFVSWSRTTRAERIEAFERVIEEYRRRHDELADAITEEMGAPISLARQAQARSGLAHLEAGLAVLRNFAFEQMRGTTRIVKEPIGVCGLITPWNWPMNQIACKVAPALATGCTIVLKPSEVAPFSAYLFAEILHAARIPAGVFNLVNGAGASVGAAIASHPGVDMVSFTGSTRAGVEVARAAAPGVKRVAQELGGKSPNIILDDADLERAVTAGVKHVLGNSGQSCNAASRMLVPADKLDEVTAIAKRVAEGMRVGDPRSGADMGPVVSPAHWLKIQELIASGIEEGAVLVTGGLGRPEGLNAGCYVKPTIFAHVKNDMTIAREEIFGPVLSIISYSSVDEAIEIANDTEYGLAAYIWGADMARVGAVAAQVRAGRVSINGAGGDLLAPFGGYKKSGNGREWGEYGFNEFLEVKAVLGYVSDAREQ